VAPELLVVDPVAALHLAVLLGAARLDVPVPDAPALDREDEAERELGTAIGLDLPRGCASFGRH
jgi:hypothetical protein